MLCLLISAGSYVIELRYVFSKMYFQAGTALPCLN